jgi:hypothetical protein
VEPDIPVRVTPGPRQEGQAQAELHGLFHRLNNQLGVILANAELLESKLTDDLHRPRAAQVVSGALDAIGTVQHLRQMVAGE